MASVELGIFKKSKCFRQLTNSLQVGFNMSDNPFEQGSFLHGSEQSYIAQSLLGVRAVDA
jgi:hypothetical protein